MGRRSSPSKLHLQCCVTASSPPRCTKKKVGNGSTAAERHGNRTHEETRLASSALCAGTGAVMYYRSKKSRHARALDSAPTLQRLLQHSARLLSFLTLSSRAELRAPILSLCQSCWVSPLDQVIRPIQAVMASRLCPTRCVDVSFRWRARRLQRFDSIRPADSGLIGPQCDSAQCRCTVHRRTPNAGVSSSMGASLADRHLPMDSPALNIFVACSPPAHGIFFIPTRPFDQVANRLVA